MPKGEHTHVKSWKDEIATDDEFAARLHAFEVVCKWTMQQRGTGFIYGNGRTRGGRKHPCLTPIGMKHFGLTGHQCNYCVMRARYFLDEIREHEQQRGLAALKAGKQPAILSWTGLRPKLQKAA